MQRIGSIGALLGCTVVGGLTCWRYNNHSRTYRVDQKVFSDLYQRYTTGDAVTKMRMRGHLTGTNAGKDLLLDSHTLMCTSFLAQPAWVRKCQYITKKSPPSAASYKLDDHQWISAAHNHVYKSIRE
jgi:hypothetical protein